jgi:hypothetical protein
VTRLKNARENTKFSFDLEDLTVIYIAETSLDKLYEFIDKEKREVLPTLISIWWFYIKVQRTCFSIYINDNRRVSVLRKGGGMGMNLIGIAIALATCFLIKYLVRWLKIYFSPLLAVWFQYYFRILAIFYFAMQNDKLKVTSIFI